MHLFVNVNKMPKLGILLRIFYCQSLRDPRKFGYNYAGLIGGFVVAT